ncbi:MAG: hypothetical protein KDI36_18955, partial [Pseudomonadales bacterium]|nr:hypothetical protein [Pseudomonadales bacterium]
MVVGSTLFNRAWLGRVVRLLVLASVFLITRLATGEPAPEENYVVVDEAVMLASDATAPPASDARWQSVSLPLFSTSDEPETAYFWFRLQLPELVADDRALLINLHMFSVRVYLNGELIGGSGEPPGMEAIGWTRPLLVNLPASLWRSGQNTLHIRLSRQPFTTALSQIVVGDAVLLAEARRQAVLWQSTSSQISLVLCVMMGLFVLGLWMRRPNDSEYGLFGVFALLWAIP